MLNQKQTEVCYLSKSLRDIKNCSVQLINFQEIDIPSCLVQFELIFSNWDLDSSGTQRPVKWSTGIVLGNRSLASGVLG